MGVSGDVVKSKQAKLITIYSLDFKTTVVQSKGWDVSALGPAKRSGRKGDKGKLTWWTLYPVEICSPTLQS